MKPLVPGFSRIDIDASSFADATNALASAGQFDVWAGLEVERMIEQCGEIVQRAVRKRAKRHYRSGKLERNVRITAVGAAWERIVRVKSGSRHAHLVAGRVRPHAIVSEGPGPASPAMPLYVGGSVTGFSQAVEHPGYKGDPYFHVGAMNSRLAINAVLKASAKKLAAHLAMLLAQSSARAEKGPI